MAKGQVVVFVSADTKNLQQQMAAAAGAVDQFEKRTESMGSKLSSAGQKMTLFASVPIVAGMAAAANAASNLEQSMGAVESIFGSAAKPVLDFGETAAESAGLSKREVNEMAAVLGASLQGMGFEAGESAVKVVELQKRGADMAATFGGTTKDALDAIASLMRGERDPIEKYGVSIKAVDVSARIMAMGLDTSTAASKKNAEAVAGLDLLMEQTAKTQGQFARESDSAAGAQQRAKASIENSAASLGENLLPLVAGAADKVAALAEKFGDLPAPVQQGVLALGGVVALAGPVLTVVGNLAKLHDTIKKVNVASLASKAPMLGFAGGLVAAAVAGKALSDSLHKDLGEVLDELANKSTAELVEGFDSASDSLDQFRLLAEKDLVTATRLRNELREMGRDTTELDRIVDGHAETQRELNKDVEKATTAIEGATDATSDLTGEIEEETRALKDLLDATLAQFNADLRYQQQVNATDESLAAYNESLAASTAAKGQDVDANEELERATLDAAEAVLSQAAAAAEMAVKQSGLASETDRAVLSAATQKRELERVASTLAPDSPLRKQLEAYAARLGALPASKTTTIGALTGAAEGQLIKVKNLLDQLADKEISVDVAISMVRQEEAQARNRPGLPGTTRPARSRARARKMADGGIVKARPGGTLALIGEAGSDEAVIPLDRARPAAGVSVNFSGPIIVQDVRDADDLVRQLVEYVRRNGPLPITTR